jgi:hypothetical protein
LGAFSQTHLVTLLVNRIYRQIRRIELGKEFLVAFLDVLPRPLLHRLQFGTRQIVVLKKSKTGIDSTKLQIVGLKKSKTGIDSTKLHFDRIKLRISFHPQS